MTLREKNSDKGSLMVVVVFGVKIKFNALNSLLLL